MVEATTQLAGIQAEQLLFQEFEFQDVFDGIWACASLLRVPLAELDDVLRRFACALRTNGICYLSFKEGEGERSEGDRQFTDFNVAELERRLCGHAGFSVIRIWLTDDVRPERNGRWVNVLVRKSAQAGESGVT
jgi:hypothetical protein